MNTPSTLTPEQIREHGRMLDRTLASSAPAPTEPQAQPGRCAVATGSAIQPSAEDAWAWVWTSQKSGPQKQEWSDGDIHEWEHDGNSLHPCHECGTLMTGVAFLELGNLCPDCRHSPNAEAEARRQETTEQ